MNDIKDIHPYTPIVSLTHKFSKAELQMTFDEDFIASLVGMNTSFIRKVLSKRGPISLGETLQLLEQDAFHETFVPRSRIPQYLVNISPEDNGVEEISLSKDHSLYLGNATNLIGHIPAGTISCVVTSTPYWGTRLYDAYYNVEWADGEVCPLGHEQTPEGFIRHTTELLYFLKSVMTSEGSIWWNLMDTYNTRTQIRASASETLKAMNGLDSRGWKDYKCRRYSSGHSYLKDGEQCMIPSRVAERASRIGLWVKSTITWKKGGSMPETVSSRVTREVEYILHLSLQRAPYFDKSAYRRLPKSHGGRNVTYESEKLTDIWYLPTSAGGSGHGAQFPIELPARCIALSTKEGDLVLDPFVGSGTTSIAAALLMRRSVGFDVSARYLGTAREALKKVSAQDEPLLFEDDSTPKQAYLWKK